ncbi:MAG TPA: DUF4440 domain-containing protein [Acidobacteriaceae bacterium]|nr:DUF4440 domain-containing protein [Acidobacteriaceae bacterium]
MQRRRLRLSPVSLFAVVFCLLLPGANPRRAVAQSDPSAATADKPASGAAPSQDNDENPLHLASRTELDVAKVVLAQQHAWNIGDIEGYVKQYKDSPDTVFIGRQVSRGYQQILDDYRHSYTTRSSMGTLTFSELDVHDLDKSFAICTGKYHLERSKHDGGSADGIFSLVLEKTPDGWKIVLDHTT